MIENITILTMRYGFGFNTDVFETNILNLAVVVRIVVKVVGSSVSTLLDQRREIILLTLSETDRKVREAKEQLEYAKNSVEEARLQAQEIRTQASQTIEQDNLAMQQKLKESLQYLQERGRQAIQLERRRIVQLVARQVADLALITTENTLSEAFEQTYSKQKELNEKHIRDTFSRLKR
jgi:F-type H+-transporting ATPase subunit b